MTLFDLFGVIRRRKYMFGAVFLTLVTAAAAVSLSMEPRYTAKAIVLVDTVGDDDSAAAALRPTSADELRISTTAELMKSRRVAEQLALHMSDDLAREAAQQSNIILPLVERGHVWVASIFDRTDEGPAEPAAVDGEERLRVATDKVIERTNVKRVVASRLIEVSATAERPEKAAAMANALVEVYQQMRRQDRRRSRQKEIERLRVQTQQAQVDLYNADLAIAKYMRENDLIAANGAAAVENRVARLETALSNAKAESVSRRLNQLLTEEKELERRLTELSIVYGTGYPEIVDLRAQLEALRLEISAERNRARAESLTRRAEIDQNAAALSSELRAVRREHFKALEANAGLRELEREAASRSSIFKTLSARLQRAEGDLSRDRDELSFVSRAVAPTSTASASTSKIMAVGMFTALMISTFLAMVAESMDRAVRSTDQVRALLGAPTLTMVPRVKSRKFGLQYLRSYIQNNQTSDYFEAIRNLFLELISKDTDHEPRLVVMTSVMPGDGKTTIANSLSEMASMFDCRAIVVSLDRRNNIRPVSANAEIDANEERMVTDAVAQMSEGRAIVTADPHGGHISTFGENGVSLRSLPRQLQKLGESWDLIIIEAPPVLRSRDAKALAAYADDILVVMEWGGVKPDALRAVRDVFDGIEIAAILNRVDLRKHAQRGYGDAIQFSVSKQRRLLPV